MTPLGYRLFVLLVFAAPFLIALTATGFMGSVQKKSTAAASAAVLTARWLS